MALTDNIWGSWHVAQVSFKLHEELAEKLGIESYRKLPVLSVSPGKRSSSTADMCEWLDGDFEDIRMMDPNGAQAGLDRSLKQV